MRLPLMLAVSAVVGVAAIGAATTLKSPTVTNNWPMRRDHDRPGPDSARVAQLFASLQATDPVICELIADQVGNFWNADHRGIGRFAGAQTNLQPVKDSISGRVTQPRAIDLLVKNLNAQNTCVRRLASKMLGNSAVDARGLSSLLASSDATVRESAAYAAGHRDSLDVRGALESALDDRTPAVVAMAAWALGEGEDARAIPALVRAARHTDAHVRATAVWALGRLNEHEQDAQTSVLPALESALTDRNIEVQRVAADAFSSIEELHVAPTALVKALASSDVELKYYAARALADIADPATTKDLVTLIGSPDRELRKSAVEALGKIGGAEAIAGLTRALNDKDREVRKAAVEALGDAKER